MCTQSSQPAPDPRGMGICIRAAADPEQGSVPWGGTVWGCWLPPRQALSPFPLAGAPRGSGRLAQERGGHVGDGGEEEDVRRRQVPHGAVRGRGSVHPCALQHPLPVLVVGAMQNGPKEAPPAPSPTPHGGHVPAPHIPTVQPPPAAPLASPPRLPGVCPRCTHPAQCGHGWHQLWAAFGEIPLLPHCSALFLSRRCARAEEGPQPRCLPPFPLLPLRTLCTLTLSSAPR